MFGFAARDSGVTLSGAMRFGLAGLALTGLTLIGGAARAQIRQTQSGPVQGITGF